ncbi:NAD(P)/FAD-dependent oxidoreductase [Rhizobium alvei]|uniref:FAD-binding oxidoreductase n=1 Tax=Rhizobium alvei TaxID=1132659 RepID=A0ABT8YRA7_9HYPH|nr:FAD-binding oxidoreductase [Rhizobium alvei]MDO6966259.1 FAD-binding oxidoreductase [Rhizobium alvei]
MTEMSDPIIIAGAGIVGAAIAFELSRRGRKVVLIDRQEPGRGASFGNMASIAINGFDAVSRPSTWKKIPFWLANPVAPVAADPLYAWRMVPWFLRFLRAGTSSRIREIEDAGASLATRSLEDLRLMLSLLGADHMLSETSCLCVFGSESEYRAGQGNLEMMGRYGLKYEILRGAEIQDREPLLTREIQHAALLPDNHFVSNPFELVGRLVAAMQSHGGTLVRGEVADVERDNGLVTGVRLTDGRTIAGSKVALTLGVHTRELAGRLAEPIPLETERGYHTQIMAPGIDLKWSIIWPERAFMITPTAGGIRVGGSVEMAGLERAPNWRRARILVDHAKFALPGLKVENAEEWMGHRPALPDTIPVISASARHPGLYYATGHGHLGLTYSATTANIMADMMTGEAPAVDMRPFRVNRF